MILVCAADDVRNFRKIWKIVVVFLNSKKICHKQNVKCLVLFKSTRQVCNHPVPEFDKNCTQNAYFLQKVDFCIIEPKNREVIERSFKTPLNFSPLQCTYLGKKSF